MMGKTAAPAADPRILETTRRYWGFDVLRPLQAEAIAAGIDHRDSLVVMPTGGGKSLCYQVPPAVAGRTDIVVSPLISLMKDQVDALRQCGYPAAALHSGRPMTVQDRIEAAFVAGRYRLLFVAPERLLRPDFLALAKRVGVRAFAIDEAHCISHWGHDFRREYRSLAVLKQHFPRASVHAYTATATERVRQDIVQQLGLNDPAVLVGTFDRPNLVYRVEPRYDDAAQVRAVIDRHRNQAVIVYCITRRETESLAAVLQQQGVRAECYHAGLESELRRRRQEAFAGEQLDVIVATVAFGMGIDRSDVRCVIHAAMPKSIEHYQQETGRAGRDGLEAECVMLYSPADTQRWESLIRLSAENAEQPEVVAGAALRLLNHMRGYAVSPVCRHKLISEYFGQAYERADCGACDVCLGESTLDYDADPDSLEVAQKILSCVARVEQRFGLAHVVRVLRGGNDRIIRELGHDRLSTYGLLRNEERRIVTELVHQLIDQGALDRTETDRPILKLNAASREVLRGERTVVLRRPRAHVTKATKIEADAWQGVDRALFEKLRALRKQIAAERHVPPFVIFSDAVLREMARRRPQTPASLKRIPGVGPNKLADFGARFLAQLKHSRA